MGEAQKTVTLTEAEFDAAVDRKVAAAVEKIVASVGKAREVANTSGDSADLRFAQALALAIAQLNNQGAGAKTFVDPEVLRERAAASAEMQDLLIHHHAEGVVCKYRLRSKVFLNERLIEPFWIGRDHVAVPTEIEWSGVPSEAMMPANEAATAVHALFLRSIGSKTDLYMPDGKTKVTYKGQVVVHGRPKAPRATAPTFNETLGIPGRGVDGLLHVLGTLHPAVQDGVSTGRGG